MFKIKKSAPPVFFLYALRCPLENVFKYIGLSVNPELRLKQHLSDLSYNKEKTEWVENLKSLNLRPDLVIIESFIDRAEASKKEIEYINLHRSTLLNSPKGVISYPVERIGSSLEKMLEVTFTTHSEVIDKLKIIAKYDQRSREQEISRLINVRYEEITSKGRTRKI